jgi:glycosyltransferase involved in cell wall biosynthesis
MIAKNEENNLPILAKSVEGCFDSVYLCDTGSTDKTVEIAQSLGWKVSHFEWIHDFAAARNFGCSHAVEDYIMWLDLDDVLTNPEGFKKWRDTAMAFADFHLATYDYASYPDGKPAVSFARERVFKNRRDKPTFNYFLHEGVRAIQGEQMSIVPSNVWKVTHRRTPDDLAKDKGRNITIFEKYLEKGNKLDARMSFYMGKELFEINKPEEAIKYLLDAASDPTTEPHDRLLSIQYAVFSCMASASMLNPENKTAKEKAEKLLIDGIKIAQQGLSLDPNRAEYFTSIGDSYIKLGKVKEAIPFFGAAMRCLPTGMPGAVFSSPIFSFSETSTKYPRNQLVRCYFSLGDIKQAKELAEETQKLYPNEETAKIIEEINKIDVSSSGFKDAKECEDIVFTCPPYGFIDWDEEIYKTKGMGGSETACIEMAKNLKIKTGRNVIVFNPRATRLTATSGVEYRPSSEVNDYMAKNKPAIHIAWRHNMKCTDAKTYLWCHDLQVPNGHDVSQVDKVICLSPFHKNYVCATQGVPENKIWTSRNGIVPERFSERKNIVKNPMKLVYPSSPDRGLDKLIIMLDEVRKKHPVELHVFYGFDNLYKANRPDLTEMADRIRKMISERPWITYHGNTEQKELTRHIMEASLWVHPANFIESFCITALETVCSSTYPITRTLGALQDTLGEARQNGFANLFEENCSTDDEVRMWSEKVCEALETKVWEKIDVDPNKYSWESVAQEWCQEFNI